MKKITVLVFISILFSIQSQGQFFKRLEKRLDDKVNQKANQVINRAGNKVENKIENKIDDFFRKKGADIDNPNMSDADKINSIFDFQTADPQYTFYSYMRIRMTINAKKKKGNTTYIQRVDYGKTGKIFSMSGMEYVDASTRKKGHSWDRMIYDIEKNTMFTFMNINNKKTQMGIKIDGTMLEQFDKTDDKEEADEEFKVVKTGRSKTIIGYKAEEYLCTSSKTKVNIWLSVKSINPFPKDVSMMKSMSGGKKKKNASFADHPMIKRKMQSGSMMLYLTFEDLKSRVKSEMEVLAFGKETTTFNTTDYKSMMDSFKDK